VRAVLVAGEPVAAVAQRAAGARVVPLAALPAQAERQRAGVLVGSRSASGARRRAAIYLSTTWAAMLAAGLALHASACGSPPPETTAATSTCPSAPPLPHCACDLVDAGEGCAEAPALAHGPALVGICPMGCAYRYLYGTASADGVCPWNALCTHPTSDGCFCYCYCTCGDWTIDGGVGWMCPV
jgi:hypothetical protein